MRVLVACEYSGAGRRLSLAECGFKLRPLDVAPVDESYILTASGGRFNFANPDASTYTIGDIAFAPAAGLTTNII